ncbi:hypothetical protein AB0D91_47335 [Streptomyces canus]|uniref:hypothetical protein n=1 Tax=Streptomyces canus TaxID=58343 RepID=UPI0033FC4ECC
MSGDARKLVITSIAIVVIVAALPASLLLSPIFGSGSTSRLTAVLTFIGVLVGASVSLIGYVLNHRTERRLVQEQEEQRRQLRLDAAMRAGQLVSPTDSGPAHPAALASGLLALTQLDYADLAVALLVDLWSDAENEGRISDETAILVIDAALRSTSSSAQLVAAELLCRNAERLDACQSLHWPNSVDGCWIPSFSPRTKLLIVEALVRMTKTSPAEEGALRSVAVRLYGIWRDDPDERVQGCIGKLIGKIVERLRDFHYRDFAHGSQMVTIDDLDRAAKSASENPDGYLAKLSDDLGEHLSEWAVSCRPQPLRPGSLSTAAM